MIGVAAGAPPGDALVGVLLGDLGFEVALDAPDAHLPAVVGVVDLGDRLDLVEEVREALELRPLVVGDLGGHVDVDGLDDLHHSALLLSGFLLSIQHGTGRSASGVDCRRGYCPGRACEVLLRRLVVKTCADATSVSYVQTTVHFSGGTRIMNRSPRRAIAVATALVCTAALASCAVGTGSGDDSDATYDPDQELSGSLSVMGFSGVDEVATSRVDLAEDTLGDVKVNLIEGDLDRQQFLSTVASGKPPEVLYANRDQIGSLSARGAIIPLDDCIAGEGIDTDAFVPSGLARVTLNDHVYGIPEFNTVQLTMANADLLGAAGLTIDDVNGSSWEAVSATNQALMKSAGGGLSVIGSDSKLPEFCRCGRRRTAPTSSRQTDARRSLMTPRSSRRSSGPCRSTTTRAGSAPSRHTGTRRTASAPATSSRRGSSVPCRWSSGT